MVADCDLRTRKLIEKEVQREPEQEYGSMYELALLKIKLQNHQVIVIGEFVGKQGEIEKSFAIVMLFSLFDSLAIIRRQGKREIGEDSEGPLGGWSPPVCFQFCL